jgi:TfuA protein
VLIDGTFRQTLAVWVKEIVFAMVDGVKFIGAASMGALRAAELSRYGAIGIGSIYDSYRTGKIEDDSWVAMTYDPDTFKPLTEPPCGMDQKRLDAVAAIEYARTNKESVQTTLTKEAVAPLLTAVFDRILDNEMLIYGER